MSNTQTKSITIANGQTLSNNVEVYDKSLVGILIPDGADTLALSFEVALTDNEQFLPYYNATGELVTITVEATRWIGLYGFDFSGAFVFRVKVDPAVTQETEYKLLFKGFSGA